MPDPFAPPQPLRNYIMLMSMQLRLSISDCNNESSSHASPRLSHNNMTPARWLEWLDGEYALLRAKAEAHLKAMGERAERYNRLDITGAGNDYLAVARAQDLPAGPSGMARVLAGYVVVYPNNPGHLNTHRYLGRRADGADGYAVVTSLATAAIFTEDVHARRRLLERPTVESTGHLAGRVDKVYREHRLVLGGESMDNLNGLLWQLRDARPSQEAAGGQ